MRTIATVPADTDTPVARSNATNALPRIVAEGTNAVCGHEPTAKPTGHSPANEDVSHARRIAHR